jgi:hypothetical protein
MGRDPTCAVEHLDLYRREVADVAAELLAGY